MLAALAAFAPAQSARPEQSATAKAAPAAANPQKGIELGDLNRRIDPCTDFYEFANGTWRTENQVPASTSRWSRRITSRDSNKQRVQSVVEDVSRKKDWTAGSIEQQIGDHFGACMDEPRINAAGLTPLTPLLSSIDNAQTLADIQSSIRRLHEVGVAVPFGVVGTMDYHAPKNFIANVVAGGLGLPERDDYMEAGQRFVEVREKYVAHVANTLALGGTPVTEARDAADAIFAMEKRMAEASLASAAAADQAGTDHKMTFTQLKQMAPHFDWNIYFAEAKLPQVDLNVAEPKFMAALDKEFETTPISTWKAYLKWRLLDSASPWLSQPFVLESFNFKDKFLGGAIELAPRAERCAELTEALFGEPVGKKYAERYFPPAAKAKVDEISRALLEILREDVKQNDWMTPGMKSKALAKLGITRVMAGYPDVWRDYSKVAVRRDSFWANVAAGRRFIVDDDRSQIGKRTNQNLWLLPASSPGAYIDLQLYKLVLPAGFLQPPFFDINATDAVNYGALGINLAHDLAHAIDALGAENDIEGRPENWWSEADRAAFDVRAQCVVDQYEGYFIEPGIHHDGKRVKGEAIGDMTGVSVAYRALQKSLASHPARLADAFTPEQQFFISWGQTTGAAMTIEAQRKLVAGDPHPTPKFRVIGPLSNSPEFA
ncbi:MAG: M13 family metallopeptidase, partial [Vicinamibacteria bacterium]